MSICFSSASLSPKTHHNLFPGVETEVKSIFFSNQPPRFVGSYQDHRSSTNAISFNTEFASVLEISSIGAPVLFILYVSEAIAMSLADWWKFSQKNPDFCQYTQPFQVPPRMSPTLRKESTRIRHAQGQLIAHEKSAN